MCMRNTSEGCILSEQQSALKKEVLSLDDRMDKLEKDFATMRSETLDGFRHGAFRDAVSGIICVAYNQSQTMPTHVVENQV